MGYTPASPPPTVAQKEMAILRRQYIDGKIEVEEFEEGIGLWLKWESLGTLGRRQLEEQEAKKFLAKQMEGLAGDVG